jgi:hypothetical protein
MGKPASAEEKGESAFFSGVFLEFGVSGWARPCLEAKHSREKYTPWKWISST